MSEKILIVSCTVKDELERFMNLHNFKSLEEVLKITPEDLLKMDGFGMRLLAEVNKLSQN